METVAVCLYSKYSQRCKEFLDDLQPQLGVQMLCIDNEEVRQAILKDNHGYHIKTVPCIFLFYPNGRLEKYEGSDAFTWLRKVQEVLNANRYQQPQQQIQPPLQPQNTPIQQLQPQNTPIQPQQKTTPIQQLQSLPLQQPFEEPEFNPSPPQPFQPPFEEPVDITPIEENGIQNVTQQQQTPEEIMNQEMEIRRASEQIITRKQDNIKELAQMMQRQRENDDEKITPPALYPKDKNGGF